MNPSIEPVLQAPLDATPFLGRSHDSVYEQLESHRAELADSLNAALSSRGIHGLVLQSSPRARECWVHVVCWTPQNGTTHLAIRRELKITLHAREFRRFPIEYEIESSGDGRTRTITSVRELRSHDIQRLVDFCTEPRAPLRKRHFLRCRPANGTLLERLTLPRNRPSHLKGRLIAGWRRYWIALLLLGLAISIYTLRTPFLYPALSIALGSIVVRLSYPVVLVKRGIRPLGEPRSLLKYDSWQTVVPDLGKDAEQLRAAVIADLKDGRHESAWIEIEKIWNWGLDSLVERDQIVLHFRRSVVFIEIHAYGADLYVDWESYLNFGVWSEQPFATGFEPGQSAPVLFHEVRADYQAIGEYDLSDANFALEWVHAVVKRHLKRLLAEHRIDEDIDFRIIREDRTAVRNARPDQNNKPKRQFRLTRQQQQ